MTLINHNFTYNNSILNISKMPFKGAVNGYSIKPALLRDGYVTNPLYDKFGTKSEIENIAKTNQRIQEILREYKLPLNVNEKELQKLKDGHLQKTRITTAKIYSNLPLELKQTINPVELQEAAMFHDYGKILIPDNILNKNGELNELEWNIMQQHSELGAELLKNKDFSPRTIELIKYHHQTPNGKGYPLSNNQYEYGLDSEILSIADKYEALREKRSYKNAMTREEALAIIQDDVKNGTVSEAVFNALTKAV